MRNPATPTKDRGRDDGAVDDVAARLREPLADEALGQHDREHHDGDDAAAYSRSWTPKRNGESSSRDDAGRDERGGQIEHRMEELGVSTTARLEATKRRGHHPEAEGLERHSPGSLGSPLAPPAAARAGFGGACMSRSLFPVAHDGLIRETEGVEPVLVEEHLAAVSGGQIEGLSMMNRVGRAHLHAQLRRTRTSRARA